MLINSSLKQSVTKDMQAKATDILLITISLRVEPKAQKQNGNLTLMLLLKKQTQRKSAKCS
jgi:hypothetical protein